MPQGKIKKIMSGKGFGFIEGANGKDIFFHHSSVAAGGFDSLQQGQLVEFEVDTDDGKGKGPRARSVMPSSKAAAALDRILSE